MTPDLLVTVGAVAFSVGNKGNINSFALFSTRDKELGVKVPLVVRLEGTNVELGKKILSESGLKITPADDMADAAEKIVSAVR